MNIIIEVKDGIVYGVYKQGRWSKRLPDIAVVDLDSVDQGEKPTANWWTLMPLAEAERITQRLMKK